MKLHDGKKNLTYTNSNCRFAEKVEIGYYLLEHSSGAARWVKVTGKEHVAAEGKIVLSVAGICWGKALHLKQGHI